MKNKDWFEVDVEGLKALQKGKDKTFVIRELIQNCWDENIDNCELEITYFRNKITIVVKDDSPEGFKNLRDAYTLFGDTSKRRNAEQRGRFNFGEKQTISICNQAMIKTTKGTVTFTKSGRNEINEKTEKGTIVQVEIDGTKEDYENMLQYSRELLVPKNITLRVNGKGINHKIPFLSFEALLLTEIEDNGFMKRTKRKTQINVIDEEHPKLYEMGIPIMDIDCKYGLDVQQKVPLSFDRESVNQTFLKELYVQVLNNVYENINPENASDSWIRLAMSGNYVAKEAIEHILKERYGDKFVVANPFDARSVDEAIANGYRVITGSEMSKEEWANIKEYELMPSSSDLFGTNFTNAPIVEPTPNQKQAGEYAKRIARRFLGFDIGVSFVNGGYNMVVAQYGGRHLTFNVSRLNNGFFDEPVSIRTTALILHELGHEAGHHTEESYHTLITELGAKLAFLALEEPEFFEVNHEK